MNFIACTAQLLTRRIVAAGAILAIGLCACSSPSKTDSGDETEDAGGGSGQDAGPTDGGPTGTGEVVTQTIGPDGGTITNGCLTLAIPAGALATNTDIKLTTTTTAAPGGFRAYSPLYLFEPVGTTLAVPATVAMCFTGDANSASLFWSHKTSTGYERIGGLPAGGVVTAEVSHFSRGFIANGVDYTDAPDLTCTRTRILDGRVGTPVSSSVAVFFSVEDCQGRPVTGLSCASYPGNCDFAVKENGLRLSSEASARILPRSGLQVFASLVLDLSSSTTADRAKLAQLIRATQSFVTRVQDPAGQPVIISLQLFAGEANVTEWQAPTLDTAKLLQRLDAILPADGGIGFVPGDPSSTNLYGAVPVALQRLSAAQADFQTRNFGGALTAGYAVLFTDGSDTAGRATLASAVGAAAAGPNQVLAVGLEGPDWDPASEDALEQIVGEGLLVAPSATTLDRDFSRLAAEITGRASRNYLLAYCSPKRGGNHAVSIEVATSTRSTAQSFSFSAASFQPGCSVSSFDNVCNEVGPGARKQCGGLGCGSCDDRLASCNSSTFQCTNFCSQQLQCGGVIISNPRGYSQACPDSPTSTSCSGTCVNPASSATHCGACGNACPGGTNVSSPSCSNGDCGFVCAANWGDCDALVANGCEKSLLADTNNCGTCGGACPLARLCSAGSCRHCSNGTEAFVAEVRFAVGSIPRSVAVGDFNQDGRLDVATANEGSNSVSVLLGTGTGTFGAASTFIVGLRPNSVAVADLNGDAFLDLVTANPGSNNVSVLLGTGTGAFTASTFVTGTAPQKVAVGDFNGDAKLDLVTTNSAAATLSVLLGTGSGAFGAPVTITMAAVPTAAVVQFATSVTVADFNGDSNLDIVTANYNSTHVSVLLGSGSGTFAQANFMAGSNTRDVAVADTNGDGQLDLVVALTGGSVAVLLGNGTGTFSAPAAFAAGNFSQSVAVGDFNGDGKPDIVTANTNSSNLSVLLGSGQGVTSAFTSAASLGVATSPSSVAIGDFNGDAKPDIVVANGAVSLLLNACSP